MPKISSVYVGTQFIFKAIAGSSEMVEEWFNKAMMRSFTNDSYTSSMPVSTKRLQMKPWTLQKQTETHWFHVLLAIS